MVVHNIIDVSPLYHKYAYAMRDTWWIQNHKEDDIPNDKIPLKYLVMEEIERMRETIEESGNRVVTSACFDSKHNLRKKLLGSDEASGYKAGRSSALVQFDFEEIEDMKNILSEVGVNVFCLDGCEADDLIAHLAKKADEYDLSIIYSTDKDMIANINSRVGMRRRVKQEWITISAKNYSSVVSESFGVRVPYNTIGLYLSTVGDTADHIAGIKGFGKKSFEKLVEKLDNEIKPNWSELSSYDKVKELLIKCKGTYLSEEQFRQAVETFNIVRPIEITNSIEDKGGTVDVDEYGFKLIKMFMEEPTVMKVETLESRVEAYRKAGMPSLMK